MLYHASVTDNEDNRRPKDNSARSAARCATAETLMRLVGRISREDADELIRIIDECCGRVDADEWGSIQNPSREPLNQFGA